MVKQFMRFLVAGVIFACAVMPWAVPARAGVITPVPPNVRVTDAGLGNDDATQSQIAIQGNTLYAAWLDERDGYSHPDVYFAKSTDGGATWSANQRVSARPYDDWPDDPVITVQPNGTIWIAWYLFYTSNSDKVNDVRLARSTDGGQTFTRYTVVNGVPDNEDLWRPAIASDDARVYVLYRLRNADGFDIKLKVVDAQTLNVTTTNVSDGVSSARNTGGLLDDGPATTLALRNGVLCAAWEDRRSTFAIYGACSTNNGASFSPNTAFSGANAINPVIALAPDGTLYATYANDADLRRNSVLRNSTDRGATWSAARTVTNVDSPFKVGTWDLAIDANGQLLLAWINSGISANDIFLSTSIDRGENFSRVPVKDGLGQYGSVSDPVRPKVVAGGDGTATRAYLVWEDDRNVNDAIWSATLALDGIAPTAPASVQAQGEDNSILLTWQPSTDAGGILGYRVYRSTTAGGPFTEITLRLNRSTFYRDVEVPASATYFYVVTAVDNSGNTGPASVVANASAQAGAAQLINGTLAYVLSNDVKLRTLADGAETTVGGAGGPRFSPDGQQLYVNSNRTILSRPPAGGSLTTFAGPFDSGIDFDVAADRTAFAIISLRQFGAPGVSGGLCTVTEPRYFERAGQEKYVDANVLASDIAISADHRWIAYRYAGFCNVAGSGIVSPPSLCFVQTANGQSTCVEGLDAKDPDFTPSGNWVVFAAPITGQDEIWKAQLQADGTLTNYTQLTRGPANQPSRSPSFSTDGNWIVFARDVDPGNTENVQLFAVRNDGFGLRALNIAGSDPDLLGGGAAPPAQGMSNRIMLPLVLKP